MPRYYLGLADDDLALWQAAFRAAAPAVLSSLGLEAGLLTPVNAAADAYAAALAEVQLKAAAAVAAVAAKKEARAAAVRQIATLVRQLQAHPDLTDSQRASLGLAPRDPVATPVPAPSTAPVVRVDTSERQRHRLYFRQSATRRGRPAGAVACEIWRSLGTAPSPAHPTSFLLVATRSPALISYDGPDAGTRAYYQLRWLNAKAQPGPWGDVVEAMILG